jgi:hypothetical protein
MSPIQNPKRFAFVCLCLAVFVCLVLFSYVGTARVAYAYFTESHPTSSRPLCPTGTMACNCQGGDGTVVCCPTDSPCNCADPNHPTCVE